MSTVPPPPDATTEAEDELVSAVLDGEATESEVRTVQDDPRLRARLDQFRLAAAAVATPPPALPDEQRSALLQAALAVADEPDAGHEGERAPAAVAPLAPRRTRRAPSTWLVAAVVVLLAGVGLALIVAGRDGGGSKSASRTTTDSAQSAGGQDEAAASKDAAGPHGQAAPTTVPGSSPAVGTTRALPYLGTFADADALRVGLKGVDPTTLQPTSSTSVPTTAPSGAQEYTANDLARCVQVPRGFEQELGEPLAYARARVGTVPVLVITFPLTDQAGKVRELAFGPGCAIPILAIDP